MDKDKSLVPNRLNNKSQLTHITSIEWIDNNDTQVLNNYKILSTIGKGSCGTVYKAVSLHSNQIYAIKKVQI